MLAVNLRNELMLEEDGRFLACITVTGIRVPSSSLS